jgi:hypothetical protein
MGRAIVRRALMLAAAIVIAAGVASSCKDNMFTGNLTPVPPVHRLPSDVAGAVILIDKDPIIETRDPVHVMRANEKRVPQQYREAMGKALVLAGFRVTSKSSDPHDLIAKLAIAVSEDDAENVRQVYRCDLASPDGATAVAQIDWTWPKGTFVDTFEVFEFATHNVATEVATSRNVVSYLKSKGSHTPAAAGPAATPAAPAAPDASGGSR